MKHKISMITPDKIRRHQSNSSTSKFAYQFSKQKRFSVPNPQCKKHFYIKQNETSLSQITFKIPKGSRSNFTKNLSCSPPSTTYLHKSIFEKNSIKGKSFGLGRQSSLDKSYLHQIRQLSKIPGPNAYNCQKIKLSKAYSMGSKTTNFNENKLSFKKAPGPGKYQATNLNPKSGRFQLSQLSDAKYCKINPNTKRFLQQKHSPGPLQYNRTDGFTPKGKYLRSKDKGLGCRVFSKAARVNFTDKFKELGKTLPAPGQYQKFSDFGVYGDMNYNKTLEDYNV